MKLNESKMNFNESKMNFNELKLTAWELNGLVAASMETGMVMASTPTETI